MAYDQELKDSLIIDSNLIWIKNYENDDSIKIIAIFGSYLKDKENAKDIDVLMIGDKFETVNFHQRRELFKTDSTEKFIDFFCYTQKEFKTLFDKNHPFLEILKNNSQCIKGDLFD